MNGAVITGYEEDVGEKTSVYVHTAHSITASMKFFKIYGYTSVPKDEVLKLCGTEMVLSWFEEDPHLSSFPSLSQGIIHVLIPEGLCDFTWLQALIRGERVTTGRHKNTV